MCWFCLGALFSDGFGFPREAAQTPALGSVSRVLDARKLIMRRCHVQSPAGKPRDTSIGSLRARRNRTQSREQPLKAVAKLSPHPIPLRSPCRFLAGRALCWARRALFRSIRAAKLAAVRLPRLQAGPTGFPKGVWRRGISRCFQDGIIRPRGSAAKLATPAIMGLRPRAA
jgi:hypothetical protein